MVADLLAEHLDAVAVARLECLAKDCRYKENSMCEGTSTEA